jgi:hypothetical protein
VIKQRPLELPSVIELLELQALHGSLALFNLPLNLLLRGFLLCRLCEPIE